MEEQAARGRRGVDGLVEHDESDAERIQLGRQFGWVPHAPREAVQLDHYDHVETPPPGVGHEATEGRPTGLGPRDAVIHVDFGDLEATGVGVPPEGLFLDLGALPEGADAALESNGLHGDLFGGWPGAR